MKVKSKVWLEKNGELIFGTGKSAILKAVDKTGSLSRAAKELNMSYRHAWSYIRTAEKRLDRRLLIRTKGGRAGGGAIITEYAKDMLRKFGELEEESKRFVDRRFKEIFE